jgi:hypothetical protein
VTIPAKQETDAETDGAFKLARDLRATLAAKDGKLGAWVIDTADAVAEHVRAQVPCDFPAARVAMALTLSLYAVNAGAGDEGMELGADILLMIAALTAERLGQGEAARGA